MRAIKVYCPPGVEPPLYAFIDALDGKLKAKLLWQIFRLRNLPACELKEPHFKHFSLERYSQMYELREKGKVLIRIVFTVQNEDVILLTSFIKRQPRDTETVEGCSFPEPRRKIGHIRADYDGWRWYNTVWPCHRALATQKVCKEIDHIYDALTAPNALKDLTTLRKFCGEHTDACIAKENKDEFSFYYVGKLCVFWIRLVTRKGDYSMYLNAYIKEESYQKYFDFLEKLRQSGETNMYGAAPYLQSEFPELRGSQKKANAILIAWIKTFETEEGDEPC